MDRVSGTRCLVAGCWQERSGPGPDIGSAVRSCTGGLLSLGPCQMPVRLADCLPESVATQVLRLSVGHSALHNSVHAMVTGSYHERSRGHIATPAVLRPVRRRA